MSTNRDRVAGASGQESDQPAAWRIVDHRNARALVTTDADTAQHAEASEHHRVDPLYLRPAADPLGLAALVVVLEALARAVLSRCRQQVEEAESETRRVSLSDDARGREWGRRSAYRDIASLVSDRIKGASHPAVEAVREVVRTGILYLEAEEPCDVTELSAPIGVVITRWSEHRKAVDHLRTVFPSLAASLEGK